MRRLGIINALIAFSVMLVPNNVQAQDEDIWQAYFDMLFEQYKVQTGDSLFGPVASTSSEARANVLFDSHKYAEAIPHFDKLVARWPTAWNYFRRGYSHYMVKNYQLAVGDLTKSIARFPDPLLSPWWVGPTVRQLSDDGSFSKNLSASLVYQYVDAYFYRAESKLLLEDYYGCIADVHDYFAHIDTTAKRFPEQENSALRMSGYCKLMLEDFRGAVPDFQAALKLDPEDSQSHYYLGVAYVREGQVPAGCRALSRAGELGFVDAYVLIKEHCGGR